MSKARTWCLAAGPRDPRAGVGPLVGRAAFWQLAAGSGVFWSFCWPAGKWGWGPVVSRAGNGLLVVGLSPAQAGCSTADVLGLVSAHWWLRLSLVPSLSHVRLFASHRLQHTRPPCTSPTPGVYWNSCPLSQWCHPTSLSSVLPFSHLQSFPASRSFQTSQFFTSGIQSIGVSASASVLPMNIQDWFPLGWTGWISLPSKDSQESSPTPQFKSINSLALSFLHSPTLTSIHDCWKNHSLD